MKRKHARSKRHTPISRTGTPTSTITQVRYAWASPKNEGMAYKHAVITRMTRATSQPHKNRNNSSRQLTCLRDGFHLVE